MTPVIAIGLAVVVLVGFAWPAVRIVITICHEGGHALVGILVGRRLSGIKLRSDTSGVTVSKGKPTGLGMVATLFAGYPAASLVGLAAAWLVSTGHASAVLWAAVVLLGLMLVALRNLYGWAVVLLGGAAVALASWYAPPVVVAYIACALTWLFLIGGPRPVLEVMRSATPQSDPGQLARLTHLPRFVWGALWLFITTGCLAVGVWLLLPIPG